MCRYQTWHGSHRMTSMSAWNAPVRFPLQYRMRSWSFPKGVLQVVWKCLFSLMIDALFFKKIIYRVSLAQSSIPPQVPHISSIQAPAPAVSSSSVTKVPSLYRVSLFSELCFLRWQWRRWQLLRRIGRRSADNRCSVLFFRYWIFHVWLLSLAVSIIGILFRLVFWCTCLY